MNIWDIIKIITFSVIIGAFLITIPVMLIFDVDFTPFLGIVSTLGGFGILWVYNHYKSQV